MIRKFRIKLIFAAMLSLLLVLLFIIGLGACINYKRLITDSDGILAILQQNDGTFPALGRADTEPFFPNEHPRDNQRFSPELPYESRYFSVFLALDGQVLSVNTGRIAAVDETAAVEYAQSVISSGHTKGFVGDYRYTAYTAAAETHVIFLDYGREMSAFRGFLITSACVSTFGLLAVLLLLFILSGRIAKPFAENYDKQKRFITDAGHELKTPLTIIDADAEVLRMDFGENEWLSDIQTQTKRLAELTNDLILLSRMEEQPETEAIEFPLSDLAEEIVEAFQAQARTHGKQLSAHIQSMLSMRGDERTIRQLLTILLDNAVKYSDEGGRIELTLEKQKEQVRLSVFNTAEFISREDLPHLFDRFYRAEQSRNSMTGGYGLGLSIASAIVNAHEGRIAAVTEDERSLMITVCLPVQ